MPEQIYNIRQDVFGILAGLKKPETQVWFLLMRIFPDGEGPVSLPNKIWPDARKLVESGIVLETERGVFTVNPDVVFMSEKPNITEAMRE